MLLYLRQHSVHATFKEDGHLNGPFSAHNPGEVAEATLGDQGLLTNQGSRLITIALL